MNEANSETFTPDVTLSERAFHRSSTIVHSTGIGPIKSLVVGPPRRIQAKDEMHPNRPLVD